jgi:hypothetical protein
VKDKNHDLLAVSHNTLNGCYVHRVSDARETEIHMAEPKVPDPSPFHTESAIAKLKRYELPGNDQIMAELIQAGETLLSSINSLILFGIRKKFLIS